MITFVANIYARFTVLLIIVFFILIAVGVSKLTGYGVQRVIGGQLLAGGIVGVIVMGMTCVLLDIMNNIRKIAGNTAEEDDGKSIAEKLGEATGKILSK